MIILTKGLGCFKHAFGGSSIMCALINKINMNEIIMAKLEMVKLTMSKSIWSNKPLIKLIWLN
jgi:hypothetical protein